VAALFDARRRGIARGGGYLSGMLCLRLMILRIAGSSRAGAEVTATRTLKARLQDMIRDPRTGFERLIVRIGMAHVTAGIGNSP
jgi:hypothetical protein